MLLIASYIFFPSMQKDPDCKSEF